MWEPAAAADRHAPHRKRTGPKPLRCTAEHLRPRSEGGRNTEDNIVAACLFCNSNRHRAKIALTPIVYRQHVQERMASGRWLSVLRKQTLKTG
ncbi:HNH endonuclease [Loktanella sp. TSTF-M6]|uniref:HNH endonuclease n=1 Tax=Loktanella gaetbuli TaxID=2881335 RepID=A0ABS8BWB3_9RHOB|nr:HNH endonuclease [Loktanella gaetbuli]